MLDSYYMSYCERAFTDFCDMHWPCSFLKGKPRCVKVELGHNTRGQQIAQGKLIKTDEYIPWYLRQWTQGFDRKFAKIEYGRLPIGWVSRGAKLGWLALWGQPYKSKVDYSLVHFASLQVE